MSRLRITVIEVNNRKEPQYFYWALIDGMTELYCGKHVRSKDEALEDLGEFVNELATKEDLERFYNQ